MERRLARRIEKRMVIDSGATTHFCSEEMNLPEEGESNKAVYLPNGKIICVKSNFLACLNTPEKFHLSRALCNTFF